VSHSFGIIIESLVSLLLALTIVYCALLNRQIKRLKTDESALKATIAELMQATGIAERAISGLKVTVLECDEGLGERLRSAHNISTQLERQLSAAQSVLERFTRLVDAAAPLQQATASAVDTKSIVAAAQAFAERARARSLAA
jgi:DNA repair exonuclease SbcCD ATPase subunit